MISATDREQTACPLCGSEAVTRRFPLQGFSFAECAGCTLLYVQDRLREEVMMRFYGEEYFSSASELSHGYENYDEMRGEREITFNGYLQRVLPHLQRREQVLDIGCGYGYFLNAARQHFRRLAGVDVSAEALRRADPSYQLYCGEFHRGMFPDGFADLVMMCDLVEHLYRPAEFLSQVREVLHAQGLLCLVTPNRRSLLSRISGRRWVSFKLPEHICYYDPATMRLLLGKAGLRMVLCVPCGQYATLGFVLKRVKRLVSKDPGEWPVPQWLRKRVLYVNSGSMLVLAARGERVADFAKSAKSVTEIPRGNYDADHRM